jgi:hypothetical protein
LIQSLHLLACHDLIAALATVGLGEAQFNAIASPTIRAFICSAASVTSGGGQGEANIWFVQQEPMRPIRRSGLGPAGFSLAGKIHF